MTIARWVFQRACALETPGLVLNVGCKEDPARLKQCWPTRVTNMDLHEVDLAPLLETGELVPIPVDVVHDATVTPWPFPDDHFGLVVLGDILEDLPDNGCQLTVLREARRVARAVCITTPEDDLTHDAHHFTTITEERLRGWLVETGWCVEAFSVVDYVTVPRGYFVLARRDQDPSRFGNNA